MLIIYVLFNFDLYLQIPFLLRYIRSDGSRTIFTAIDNLFLFGQVTRQEVDGVITLRMLDFLSEDEVVINATGNIRFRTKI